MYMIYENPKTSHVVPVKASFQWMAFLTPNFWSWIKGMTNLGWIHTAIMVVLGWLVVPYIIQCIYAGVKAGEHSAKYLQQHGYERDENKSLKVVESESVVVSKIFKLYSEHKSLGKVAESLSRQNVETRRGKPFSRMTIKNILNNKTYAGRIVHNGMETKGLHKPIVSTRMWNRCNQMLSE